MKIDKLNYNGLFYYSLSSLKYDNRRSQNLIEFRENSDSTNLKIKNLWFLISWKPKEFQENNKSLPQENTWNILDLNVYWLRGSCGPIIKK